MTTSEILSLISAVAAVLQTIVITVTLIYIYHQTVALRRTVEDLERNARLNSYTNLRSVIHEINKLLLENNDLAKAFGFSEKELLGFIIMNYFEMLYLQRLYGVLDDEVWQAQSILLEKNIGRDFIQAIWPTHKDEFHPKFVEYVESILEKRKSERHSPSQKA